MSSELRNLYNAFAGLKRSHDTNKIALYKPYPFQLAFHQAEDLETYSAPFEIAERPTKLAVQRALMAANQVGKTFCAASEVSYHATGRYPDWWKGHRFKKPVQIIVAGKRNETTRDVCQSELLGDPFDESALGTGTIPLDYIGKRFKKTGVPNALSAVLVKHVSGGFSRIRLMSFEQGTDAFMGIRFEVCWADEEPPIEIWSQLNRGVFSRKQYTILMTFTPEEGQTQVVDNLLNHLQEGQALVRAGWDDAPHMTPNEKEKHLAIMLPHERDMRTKGIPIMGSGLVFPIKNEDIECEPIEIPAHWPRIAGVDFGSDHPFAAAWVAWDRDTDIVYIYDAYKKSRALIAEDVSVINKHGTWIPVVWPHDGMQEDKQSGKTMAELYREEGANMRPVKFTNPPGPGEDEGKGGHGVEAGLKDMYERMETGRLKVFSTLREWFEEKEQYHRKNGILVKRKDDIMSASRYAVMSLRHAITRPIQRVHVTTRRGLRNWS